MNGSPSLSPLLDCASIISRSNQKFTPGFLILILAYLLFIARLISVVIHASRPLPIMDSSSLEEKGLHIVLKEGVLDISSRDDAALTRLGKKPVLKRNFGFMSILGFSCTVLITWEGSLTYVGSHIHSTDLYVTDLTHSTFLAGLQK